MSVEVLFSILLPLSLGSVCLAVMRFSALALCLGLSLVGADSIDHDKVVGFDTTVPTGTTGDVYQAYQPYLKVVNGCVPFPGVDADGNTKYVDFILPVSILPDLPPLHTSNTSHLTRPVPVSIPPALPPPTARPARGKSTSALATPRLAVPTRCSTHGTSPRTRPARDSATATTGRA